MTNKDEISSFLKVLKKFLKSKKEKETNYDKNERSKC